MFLFKNKQDLNIFTIRHGESIANVNRRIYNKYPDRHIKLTNKGHEQAKNTGVFLSKNFNIHSNNTLIFSSSYKRAIQTAKNINLSLFLNIQIDDRIVEKNHGVFEGLSKKEQFKLYPHEAERFYKQKQLGNDFFTSAPMGESSFDVALRFHNFWNDIEKVINVSNVKNIIIVAHGLTNLVIQKELMNYSVDWYNCQEEIPNCGVFNFKLHRDNNFIRDFGLIYAP